MAKRRKRTGSLPAQETSTLSGLALLLVETPAATLDLHGLTGAQAGLRVRDFLLTQAVLASGRVVHIVTGRGTRSEAGPVLPEVAGRVLREHSGTRVDQFAGLPGGGGFAARML